MASKRSGKKSRSVVAAAGKRTVSKAGARLRDLEAKKGKQVRGGDISFNYSQIKYDYKT
jgi:hypothetical protein